MVAMSEALRGVESRLGLFDPLLGTLDERPLPRALG